MKSGRYCQEQNERTGGEYKLANQVAKHIGRIMCGRPHFETCCPVEEELGLLMEITNIS